jgi:hypothetical protein
MSKSTLVFFPTGLNTPEAEVLSSNIQSLLDKKIDVTILTCKGGKDYSCAKNLFSINLICTLCKKKRNKYFEKIVGDFKIIETPKYKSSKINKKLLNNKSLKNYFYKTFDNGLATLSSYLTLTRDLYLNGFFAKKIISQNLMLTNFLTDFYYKFINVNKFTEIYSFNSRTNLYRPLFRICLKLNIKFNNLECITGNKLYPTRILNFKDSLPSDYDKIPNLINLHWKKNKHIKKDKIVNSFYHSIKKKAVNTPDSNKNYLIKQEYGSLPKIWNNKNYNITFYASSEDEKETVIKKNFNPLFKNQINAIIEILSIIKNQKNYILWLRMHPNMDNIKWKYVDNLYELEKNFQNVFVIRPHSNISTNSLIENSNLNIGLDSRTLLESIFIKKPTIILGKNFFSQIGKCNVSKNVRQLKKMIISKKVPISPKIVPSKFAFFWSTYGERHKYLRGKFLFNKKNQVINHVFKFKNHTISLSKFENSIYFFVKSIEKILIYLNYKLSSDK